jgi:hypothetical protein
MSQKKGAKGVPLLVSVVQNPTGYQNAKQPLDMEKVAQKAESDQARRKSGYWS